MEGYEFKIVMGIFAFVAILLLVRVSSETTTSVDIKRSAERLQYEQSKRYPDKWNNEPVYLEGSVIDVIRDGGNRPLEMIVTLDGKTGKEVYVTGLDSDAKIIERDSLRIWGVASGMFTYETVMGDMNTVPLVVYEDSVQNG